MNHCPQIETLINCTFNSTLFSFADYLQCLAIYRVKDDFVGKIAF